MNGRCSDHSWGALRRLGRQGSQGLVACAWLALTTGCVKNPVTGNPELALLSPEDERRIGAEAAAEVESGVGLTVDPVLTPYVRRLGAQLAKYSPRQGMAYAFDILDVPEPNAFALPDGHVYVSRGLIALSNEEDELATILGHEIGHVAARHAAQRYSRAAPVGILTGITSSIVGVVSSRAGRAVSGFGGGLNALMLAPYGREQEHEADRVGQDIAAHAGWNPAALTDALTSLGRFQEGLSGGRREPSFLDSHPSTPERVEQTRRHATELRVTPHGNTAGREAFLAQLDGLLVGKNPRHGVFVDTLLLHPGLGLSVAFPHGWMTARSKAMAAAQSPQEDAVCMLGPGPEGTSALDTLTRIGRDAELEFSTGPTERSIGGRSAAQASVQGEKVQLTLVFVEHRGKLLQLVALTEIARAAAYASNFESWIASLRDMSPAERGAIRELRLQVVPSATGDELEEVARRHGSAASPKLLAILNGVAESDTPLPGGSIKLIVERHMADTGAATETAN